MDAVVVGDGALLHASVAGIGVLVHVVVGGDGALVHAGVAACAFVGVHQYPVGSIHVHCAVSGYISAQVL